MPLAFIAASSNGASTGNFSVTNPAGLAEGNLLLAFANQVEGGGDLAIPAGFTSFINVHDTAGPCFPAAANIHFQVGWKIASAADIAAGSLLFTMPGGSRGGGILCSFSGHNPTSPIHASAFVQNNTIATPSVLTTIADCLLLRLKAAGHGCFSTRMTGCAGTTPSGYTLRQEYCVTGHAELAVHTKNALIAQGAQGIVNVDVGGAYAVPYHYGITIALAPVAGHGGGGGTPGKGGPPKPPSGKPSPKRPSFFSGPQDYWGELRR